MDHFKTNPAALIWLAVHTKPRQEAMAAANLQRQGFEVFLPELRQRKRRQNRWQWFNGPLFPRYLFLAVTLGEQDIARVRSTLGVVNLVQFGAKLAEVDPGIIDFLQAQQQGDHATAELDGAAYRPGDRVPVLEGPFAGLDGIYQMKKDSDRVELLLSLMGRKLPVVLQLDQLGSAH
ncbi:transcriptional activator RfaH [Seongchinamella sediminis]|uniref:Transcriptional activator RfaH n=1 Tax=Seongchinamella sediminis TaxID=2283635 RepID=A0A3L7DUC5_9GAMM|nr:transcriptional activator RfaH [Seongchinamella sediminis]RLQ21187.1 transcriptional activator RfaH [Seongchinamella sediminis]